ncbi:lachesin-like [Macrobrachium nipponense]|uniref:lachesin-like n=1 Tax=Macrobrachium nipponense TaxID=159736 RepID=UPI0030C83D5E
MPRLSLTADHKSAALTISPVRAQDRGWYMCQVNTDPMTYTRSYLQVLVPPVLTEWSGSSVEAREGAAVSLICSARAYPPANTTWRRTDAEPIFEKPRIVWVIEGPDLVFPSVRREHHAAYTCHVTNGVTTPVSRTTYLTVTYAPLIWLERDMVGTKAGVDATLNCTSEGNPTPRHSWSVNSSNITESSKYHMEEVKNGTRTKFILTVRNPGPGDFTFYGCHAVNPTGYAKGTINLFEIREQVISVPTQPAWHTTTPETFFEPQEIPKSPQMPSASSPINHSSNKIRVDTQRRKNVVTNRLPPSPSDEYKLGGKGQVYPPRIAETPVGRNRTSFKELFNFIPLSNRSCVGCISMSPFVFFFLTCLVRILAAVDCGLK